MNSATQSPRQRPPFPVTARLLRVAATAAMLLVTACCTTGPRAVQPSFAGVPQAIARSADYPLPLSAAHREDLLKFLASDGNRFQMAEDPPDDVALNRAQTAYNALLTELGRRAPAPADLQPGAALHEMFDRTLSPMAVHDSRIGWEGDPLQPIAIPAADLTGLVKGQYVFAFYARRLVPPAGDPTAPTDAWSLTARATDGRFTGLVVFHRNYAIPEPLR